MKYTAHLLRHTAKKCPQRIKDTPAVLFCLTPCICTVYFKRLTETMLLLKILDVQKVRLRVFLYAPSIFRTDTDVRGSMQQRCFCGTKTRVQKCTRRYTSGQAIFKRLTERLFYYVATENPQRIKIANR